MSIIDIAALLSLVVGIVSVVLAVVAIQFTRTTDREIRASFNDTREMMANQHERTKDVLAEIDKRATVIETTVTDAQHQLLNTVTTLLQQSIPAKGGIPERLAEQFMSKLLESENPMQVLAQLGSLAELGGMPSVDHKPTDHADIKRTAK